jgi:hypothetical protein
MILRVPKFRKKYKLNIKFMIVKDILKINMYWLLENLRCNYMIVILIDLHK